jgi:hypothetical protein
MKYFQNQQVTGSFTILGDLDIQGAITALTQSVASASISETSSYALTASYALNAGSGGGGGGTRIPNYIHLQNSSAVIASSGAGNNKGMKWDTFFTSQSQDANVVYFGAADSHYFQPKRAGAYEFDLTITFQPGIVPTGSQISIGLSRQFGWDATGSYTPGGSQDISKPFYGTTNANTRKSINLKTVMICTPYDRVYTSIFRSGSSPDPLRTVTGSEAYLNNWIIRELPSTI